jgi:hypothetical protein
MERLVLLACLAGCSALVAPEDVPLRCSDDDACPPQMTCSEDGVCVTDQAGDGDADGDGDGDGDGDADCTPQGEERCNGIDDDCDGDTDEGHDADGDGVTWCNGGNEDGRDCDDQDPNETPGSLEVCDGHDNDCNGAVDDDACAAGVCEPASGMCVEQDCRDLGCQAGQSCTEEDGAWQCVDSELPDDCRDGSLQCGEDEVCNDQDGQCVPLGGLGDVCRDDRECADGLCVSPASLRMPDGDRFCARNCCGSGDCPGGTVCWQPGGGVSACVSRERLGLGDGAAGEGAECGQDADCASGVCRGGSCADPCCLDAGCDGGDSCTVEIDAEADHVDVACGSGGIGDAGWPCEVNEDCASSLCIDTGYCTAACCTSAGCGEGMVCVHAQLIDVDTEPYARLCVSDSGWAGPNHGEGPAGSSCFDGADCRSDRCEDGVCVDTCCSQADCPAGTSCRVREVLGGGELLCLAD